MARREDSDFFVQFGSNARDFSQRLPGELAGAKQAIAALKADLASLFSEAENASPSLGQGLLDELRQMNQQIQSMSSNLGGLNRELEAIVNRLGKASAAAANSATPARTRTAPAVGATQQVAPETVAAAQPRRTATPAPSPADTAMARQAERDAQAVSDALQKTAQATGRAKTSMQQAVVGGEAAARAAAELATQAKEQQKVAEQRVQAEREATEAQYRILENGKYIRDYTKRDLDRMKLGGRKGRAPVDPTEVTLTQLANLAEISTAGLNKSQLIDELNKVISTASRAVGKRLEADAEEASRTAARLRRTPAGQLVGGADQKVGIFSEDELRKFKPAALNKHARRLGVETGHLLDLSDTVIKAATEDLSNLNATFRLVYQTQQQNLIDRIKEMQSTLPSAAAEEASQPTPTPTPPRAGRKAVEPKTVKVTPPPTPTPTPPAAPVPPKVTAKKAAAEPVEVAQPVAEQVVATTKDVDASTKLAAESAAPRVAEAAKSAVTVIAEQIAAATAAIGQSADLSPDMQASVMAKVQEKALAQVRGQMAEMDLPTLRTHAEGAGIEGAGRLNSATLRKRLEAVIVAEAAAMTAAAPDARPNFAEMDLPTLRTHAESAGIEGFGRMNSATLRKRLEAATEQQQTAQAEITAEVEEQAELEKEITSLTREELAAKRAELEARYAERREAELQSTGHFKRLPKSLREEVDAAGGRFETAGAELLRENAAETAAREAAQLGARAIPLTGDDPRSGTDRDWKAIQKRASDLLEEFSGPIAQAAQEAEARRPTTFASELQRGVANFEEYQRLLIDLASEKTEEIQKAIDLLSKSGIQAWDPRTGEVSGRERGTAQPFRADMDDSRPGVGPAWDWEAGSPQGRKVKKAQEAEERARQVMEQRRQYLDSVDVGLGVYKGQAPETGTLEAQDFHARTLERVRAESDLGKANADYLKALENTKKALQALEEAANKAADDSIPKSVAQAGVSDGTHGPTGAVIPTPAKTRGQDPFQVTGARAQAQTAQEWADTPAALDLVKAYQARIHQFATEQAMNVLLDNPRFTPFSSDSGRSFSQLSGPGDERVPVPGIDPELDYRLPITIGELRSREALLKKAIAEIDEYLLQVNEVLQQASPDQQEQISQRLASQFGLPAGDQRFGVGSDLYEGARLRQAIRDRTQARRDEETIEELIPGYDPAHGYTRTIEGKPTRYEDQRALVSGLMSTLFDPRVVPGTSKNDPMARNYEKITRKGLVGTFGRLFGEGQVTDQALGRAAKLMDVLYGAAPDEEGAKELSGYDQFMRKGARRGGLLQDLGMAGSAKRKLDAFAERHGIAPDAELESIADEVVRKQLAKLRTALEKSHEKVQRQLDEFDKWYNTFAGTPLEEPSQETKRLRQGERKRDIEAANKAKRESYLLHGHKDPAPATLHELLGITETQRGLSSTNKDFQRGLALEETVEAYRKSMEAGQPDRLLNQRIGDALQQAKQPIVPTGLDPRAVAEQLEVAEASVQQSRAQLVKAEAAAAKLAAQQAVQDTRLEATRAGFASGSRVKTTLGTTVEDFREEFSRSAPAKRFATDEEGAAYASQAYYRGRLAAGRTEGQQGFSDADLAKSMAAARAQQEEALRELQALPDLTAEIEQARAAIAKARKDLKLSERGATEAQQAAAEPRYTLTDTELEAATRVAQQQQAGAARVAVRDANLPMAKLQGSTLDEMAASYAKIVAASAQVDTSAAKTALSRKEEAEAAAQVTAAMVQSSPLMAEQAREAGTAADEYARILEVAERAKGLLAEGSGAKHFRGSLRNQLQDFLGEDRGGDLTHDLVERAQAAAREAFGALDPSMVATGRELNIAPRMMEAAQHAQRLLADGEESKQTLGRARNVLQDFLQEERGGLLSSELIERAIQKASQLPGGGGPGSGGIGGTGGLGGGGSYDPIIAAINQVRQAILSCCEKQRAEQRKAVSSAGKAEAPKPRQARTKAREGDIDEQTGIQKPIIESETPAPTNVPKKKRAARTPAQVSQEAGAASAVEAVEPGLTAAQQQRLADRAQRVAEREAQRQAELLRRRATLSPEVQQLIADGGPGADLKAVRQMVAEGHDRSYAASAVGDQLGYTGEQVRTLRAEYQELVAATRRSNAEMESQAREQAAVSEATAAHAKRLASTAAVQHLLTEETREAIAALRDLEEQQMRAAQAGQAFDGGDQLHAAQARVRFLVDEDLRAYTPSRVQPGQQPITDDRRRTIGREILDVSGPEYDALGRVGLLQYAAGLEAALPQVAPPFRSKLAQALFGDGGFGGRSIAAMGTFMVRNFAAGAVFGLTRHLKSLLRQGLETEAEFVRISDALGATGRSAGNLRASLASISSDIAVPLEEVYVTASALVGVFDNEHDVEFATRAVEELKLISRGALNAQEGIRALASVTEAYGLSGPEAFQEVVDKVTALQNRTGVNAENLLEGAGGIAAQGQQLGFSLEQGMAITGLVAKRTGQQGTGAAEQMSRYLSGLQSSRGRQMLRRMGLASEDELERNDFGAIFTSIMRAFANAQAEEAGRDKPFSLSPTLNKQQQADLINVAGSRQARVATAAFQNAEGTLKAIDAANNATGEGARRVKELMSQLNREIQQLSVNFGNMGAALVRSGMLDYLKAVLNVVNPLVRRVSDLFNILGQLRESNPLLSSVMNLATLAGGTLMTGRLVGVGVQGFRARLQRSAVTRAGTQAQAEALGLVSAATVGAGALGIPRRTQIAQGGLRGGGILGGSLALPAILLGQMAARRTGPDGEASAFGRTLRGAADKFSSGAERVAALQRGDIGDSPQGLKAGSNGMARLGAMGGKLGTDMAAAAERGGRLTRVTTALGSGLGKLGGMIQGAAVHAAMLGHSFTRLRMGSGLASLAVRGLNFALLAGIPAFIALSSIVSAQQERRRRDREILESYGLKPQDDESLGREEAEKQRDEIKERLSKSKSLWGRATEDTAHFFSNLWDSLTKHTGEEDLDRPGFMAARGVAAEIKGNPEMQALHERLSAVSEDVYMRMRQFGADAEELAEAQKALYEIGLDIDRLPMTNQARDEWLLVHGEVVRQFKFQKENFAQTKEGIRRLNQLTSEGVAALMDAASTLSGMDRSSRADFGPSLYENLWADDITPGSAAEKKVRSIFEPRQAEDPLQRFRAIEQGQTGLGTASLLPSEAEVTKGLIDLYQNDLIPTTLSNIGAAGGEVEQLEELQDRLKSQYATLASLRKSQADGELNDALALIELLEATGQDTVAVLEAAAALIEATLPSLDENSAEYLAAVRRAMEFKKRALRAPLEDALDALSIQMADPELSELQRAALGQKKAQMELDFVQAHPEMHDKAAVRDAKIAVSNAAGARKSAAKAAADEARAIEEARQQYLIELINDPFAKVQAQLNEVIRQESHALKNDKAKYWSLKQQEVQLREQQAQLIAQVADARFNLAIAIADSAGDTVLSSQEKEKQAVAALNEAVRKSGGNMEAPEVINAQAGVVGARAAVRDAMLQNTLDDLSFQKDMGEITTMAYVAQLKGLLAQAETLKLTKQQRQNLARMIKQASEEMDGIWNIGDIKMPTPYEMRRTIAANQAALPYQAGQTVIPIQPTADSTIYNQATQTTVNIEINGADLARVQQVLSQYLGQGVIQTVGTSSRKV